MALSQDEFFSDDFEMDFGGLEPGAIDLSALSEQVDELSKRLFPEQGLSADEQAELQALSQRARRLQPVEFQPPQSTAIPGNPYSYDISPIIGGVQKGLQAIVNAARERRQLQPSERGKNMMEGSEQMREFAKTVENPVRKAEILEQADAIDKAAQATSLQGRLSQLAMRQQQGQLAQEQRGELMQELFPDLAGRFVQGQKEAFVENVRNVNELEQIAQKYGFRADELSTRGAQRLAELDKRLQNELTVMEKQQELGTGPGGKAQFAKANDLRQIVDNMADNLRKEIININNDFSLSPEQMRERTEKIEERIDGLYNNTLVNVLSSLGLTEEQAKAFSQGENPGAMIGNEDEEGDDTESGSVSWDDL